MTLSYPKNAWYLAAWSDEVAPGKMLARRLLDVPVVLLRTRDGRLSALHDMCPHRFAPLSAGRITATGVQCGYHGLEFDLGGKCTGNPHGPIARAATVRAFTVHEAYHGIWIWMGDKSPDLQQLPDLGFVDATPASAFSKGYLYSVGNYRLYLDNIMDLTHVDYLHDSTLGGGAITRAQAEVLDTADGVTVSWLAKNDRLSPALENVLKLGDRPADIWTEVRWMPPTVIELIHGGGPAGCAREEGMSSRNLHLVTPESEHSTHYFFAATRTYKVDDEEFNQASAKLRAQIFSTEDKPMIEAQHERMAGRDFWSLRPVLFKADKALVLVRRRLEKLTAVEEQERATPPAASAVNLP